MLADVRETLETIGDFSAWGRLFSLEKRPAFSVECATLCSLPGMGRITAETCRIYSHRSATLCCSFFFKQSIGATGVLFGIECLMYKSSKVD